MIDLDVQMPKCRFAPRLVQQGGVTTPCLLDHSSIIDACVSAS